MGSGYKKGNLFVDGVLLVLAVFVFFFGILFGGDILDQLNDDVQASDDMSNTTKERLDQLNTRYPNFMDSLFVFLFVLLWIVVIIASFFIDTSPVFLILGIILMGILIYVSIELGNFTEELTSDEELTARADEYPMSNYILQNLGVFIIIIASTIGLALYGKQRFFND